MESGSCARRGNVARAVLAIAAMVAMLWPAALRGQTTGTVEGTVTDQSNAPLPGVTVELTSPNLQGTRSAVTSADGRYRFPAVPPGAYKVTAELSGFGRVEKRATVTLDATASVNLSLSLSTTAEITVTGEAPLVDSTSTTQGSNYSAKVIDKLPVGRNYADVAFSQPGVQADFGETQGRSLAISVYGSTSSENLFLIDGVNTTNVIKGFQGKDINNEFIQEVEVKTGGYQAEYGRNTGGVINVITKSGGNEFHGGVFGYYNDTGMRADQVNGEAAEVFAPDFSETGAAQNGANGTNNIYSKDVRQEWGADLGGFIVKDKVWFFGAYDRVQINQNLTPLDPNNQTTFGLDFPVSYFQNKYSGKLTFNILQGTSIVGSVFSDSQTQQGALYPRIPTSLNPVSYAGRRDTGGPDYGARLNQLFGSFGIFTFQYAQHSDRYATKPFGLDIPQLLDYTGSPNGTSSVARNGYGLVAGTTNNNQSNRSLYSASFTGYVGNHEVKIGGDYQDDATSGVTYYTGQVRNRVRPCTQTGSSVCDLTKAPIYDNGLPGSQHYVGPVFYQHDVYADGTVNSFEVIPGAPFNTPSKRYSAYLQDQWRIIPTLTMNLGVRYDTENFYGFDPNPEVGEFKAFSLTDQWAPRIGVVWDFIGDGTSKLYASAGRFYFSLPTDLNVRVFTANSAVYTYNYTPDNRTQDPDAPRSQLFQGGSASGEPVDAGTKAAYQDELAIGVEKAIDPTLSLGLKGTYRTLGRTVEDRCDLDGELAAEPDGFDVRAVQPGRFRPGRERRVPDLQRDGQPDRSDRRRLLHHGLRGGRCQAHLPRHRVRGPQAVHQRAVDPGLVPVLVVEGQLLRRHPRGLGPDGPRHQRRLRLLPVHVQRLRQPRARPAGPGPHRRGLQRAVRPLGGPRVLRPQRSAGVASGLLQQLLPGSALSRHPGHEQPDVLRQPAHPDGLRPEPLARVQREHRPGDDHAAGLPVQRAQPADGRGLRQPVESGRQLRDGYDEPALRSGWPGARRGHLPGDRPRLPARTTRTT